MIIAEFNWALPDYIIILMHVCSRGNSFAALLLHASILTYRTPPKTVSS